MDCPFCGKEMISGAVKLPPASKALLPYKGDVGWYENDRYVEEIRLGNSMGGFNPCFRAYRCDDCHKLIMSIEVPEDLEIDKMTCPNCGARIDYDYPKCPECKYNFYDE